MCIVALMLTLCILIPANIITADATQTFYDSATTAPIINNIEKDAGLSYTSTAQGACTDGKYAYFAMNNGYTTILKYDVKTWKLKKKSSSMYIGHANDMTYNSRKNTIIVANNIPDYKILTFIDPDTLQITGTKKIKYKIHSISYNETYDTYVVGLSGTYNFAILDSKFKLISKHKGYGSGYVRQGGDCDDNYLYFVQSSGGGNLIVIYNWSGNLVDTVFIDNSMEIENIFHVKNTFFITLQHYGNYVHRIGISDKTAIKYKVKFDSNGGTGEMKSITVKYGKYKKLPECNYEKEGYFFGGWIMRRDSYKKYYGKKTPYSKSTWLNKDDVYEYSLFKDENKTGKTTNLGNVTATAFWIKESYQVHYDSNGGEGYMPFHTVGYDETFKPNKNRFTKNGYIFSGFYAQRECDNKIYGYKKNKDEPKWLHPKDVHEKYIFSDTEEVSKLTYDSYVTFIVQWESAFKFNKTETVLTKYNGIDKDVVFPKTADKVNTIKEEAFANNTIMQNVTIPSTITTIEKNAFAGCASLDTIYFDKNMPEDVDLTSFDSPPAKKCYLKIGDEDILLGFYTGGYSYNLLYKIHTNYLS